MTSASLSFRARIPLSSLTKKTYPEESSLPQSTLPSPSSYGDPAASDSRSVGMAPPEAVRKTGARSRSVISAGKETFSKNRS